MMLRNYITVAVRNLVRHRFYSAINVVGLAIGMACFVMITLFVQYETSFDGQHAKADRIYRLNFRSGDRWSAMAPDPMGPLLKEAFPGIASYVRMYGAEDVLVQSDVARVYEDVMYADPNLFEVFDIPFVDGGEAPLSDPSALVLTKASAEKYFGTDRVVGRTLRVWDRDHVVTGVVDDVPNNSTVDFELLAPRSALEGVRTDLDSWCCSNYPTYALMSEEADVMPIEDGYEDLMLGRGAKPDRRFLNELEMQKLADIHLYEEGAIGYVYAFSAIALFIVAIAAFNFVNLATARAHERAREVGLRKAIGARQGQLIQQFLGEAVLITVAALPISVALIEVALPYLTQLAGVEVSLSYAEDIGVALGLVAITLAIGVFAGLYPAAYLSALSPTRVLRGDSGLGGGRASLRRVLVVLQFATSIVLMIGTAVVVKQLHYMQSKEIGYEREHVLAIERLESAMPFRSEAEEQKYEVLKRSLEGLSGVEAVSVTSMAPVGKGIGRWAFRHEGETSTQSIASWIVDEDTKNLLGLNLIAGRWLRDDRSADLRESYVVNETAARERLGLSDPADAIGMRVQWTGNWGTVVGVVRDFHYEGVQNSLQPLLMTMNVNYLEYSQVFCLVKTRSDNLARTMRDIENVWDRVPPDHPLVQSFLDDDFDRLYRNEERLAALIGVFASLAIFVGSLGLLGLVAFSARQRTREIGIRKSLGASTESVFGLLSSEFLKLVVIANLFAWPVAYWVMSLWLEGFAFRTEMGPGVFLGGGVAALAMAFATVAYRVRTAAGISPVEALRE